MSINVKTENVKDATIQVHIAFENAAPRRKRRGASRQWNRADLRTAEPITLTTGKNKAEHQSSTKQKQPPHYTMLPKPEEPL